jgi:hypothetical protein
MFKTKLNAYITYKTFTFSITQQGYLEDVEYEYDSWD